MRCPRCSGTKKVTVMVRRNGKMVPEWKACPQCHGKGQVVDPRPAMDKKAAENRAKTYKQCPACHGSRFFTETVFKLVKGEKVASGTRRRTCRRCKGKGEVKKGFFG